VGKFLRPVSPRNDDSAPRLPDPVCMSCKWDFREQHWELVPRGNKRLNTRTQINIPLRSGGYVVRCDECYERELRAHGRDRYAGMTSEELHAWGKLAPDVARCIPSVQKHLMRDAA